MNFVFKVLGISFVFSSVVDKLYHHLLSIHSHHTESVGAEIRSKHLEELDSLAGDVTAVELRDGGGPDHLRQ